MQKIIAFSGKKLSGKTTAIDAILAHCMSMGITVAAVNFADSLKQLFIEYFVEPAFPNGVPVLGESGDTRVIKNIDIIDLSLEDVKRVAHPCGKTFRELLQYLGTDAMRKVWPDVWIEKWKHELREMCPNYDLILVSDVRFANELVAVQSLGGKVVRLLRNPYNDQHESETALDEIQSRQQFEIDGRVTIGDGLPRFDLIIDNRNMTIEQQNEAVMSLLTEKGWL